MQYNLKHSKNNFPFCNAITNSIHIPLIMKLKNNLSFKRYLQASNHTTAICVKVIKIDYI